MRVILTLHEREIEFLDQHSGGVTPQAFVRALMLDASSKPATLERCRQLAEKAATLAEGGHVQGQRRGFDADDYRDAIAEAGSLQGAARHLGVNRSTVREMAVIHEIPVPSMGGKVPS